MFNHVFSHVDIVAAALDDAANASAAAPLRLIALIDHYLMAS